MFNFYSVWGRNGLGVYSTYKRAVDALDYLSQCGLAAHESFEEAVVYAYKRFFELNPEYDRYCVLSLNYTYYKKDMLPMMHGVSYGK